MASTKDRFPCTGIEACRLRYLKFSCMDEAATIEFYQTLGMTLDGRSTFGRNHYVFRMAYRTSSPEFNENSLQLQFEVAKPPIGGGGPTDANGAAGSDPAAAAAQAPRSPAVATTAASDYPDTSGDPVANLAGPVLFDRTCPRDYLIVYMHFLPRVIKRLHAKGFRALLGMQTVMDTIHYAIYLDPNGVEVRLMELPDVHLNEGGGGGPTTRAGASRMGQGGAGGAGGGGGGGGGGAASKASWFARIGYYVAQVAHADEFRHYLESLFSKQRRTTAMLRALQQAPASLDPSASGASAGTNLASVAAAPSTATTTSTYLKSNIANALHAGSPGAGSGASSKRTNAADRFYQREGIRLVDAEDIATGLQQTKYLWFGQLPRDKMGTLCVSERTGAGEHAAGGGGAAGALMGAVAAAAVGRRGPAGAALGTAAAGAEAGVGKSAAGVGIPAVTANPAIRRNHRLLAIGIEVGCTVDQAVAQILREAPECLIVQDERWKVQDLGYIARARGMYGFIFELISTQDPFPGEPTFLRLNMQQQLLQSNGGKRPYGASSLANTRTGTADGPGGSVRPRADPYINFNQPLRATLSESALCRPAIWTGGGPAGVLRPMMVNGVDVGSAEGASAGASAAASVASSRPGTRSGVSGMKRRKSM